MKKKKLNESIMKNLKEYVNIENIYPTQGEGDIWLSGDCNINDHGYHFNAKVYQEPSEFGINGGKVSKLCIGDDEKCILNYDRGWDILDPMITPDILEDMVEALEMFRDENPYEVDELDESLKEDFWNPGKYFRALQDMEDIDADKWNNANQEERDKMVKPYLTNFWNKYKEEMTQADLDALFDDMEDSNYHTPARILADIINKDRNKGIKESAKTLKEEFMIPENVEDGWGDDIEDLLEEPIDRVERLGYEVRNAIRGSYADFGDTPDHLVEELYSIAKHFEEVADELQSQGYEYIEEDDEELEESCGKKKKKAIKEGVEDTSLGPVVDHIKRDIENMIHQGFDGTDFLVSVNDIDLNSGVISVHVTAFGPDENEDGNNAMERDIELHIPSLNYEVALFDEIEKWMSEHSSPDVFYEGFNVGDKTLQEKINQENKEINEIIGKVLRSKTAARKYEDKLKDLGITIDYSEPQGVILIGSNGKRLEASRDFVGGPSRPGQRGTHNKPSTPYARYVREDEKELAELNAMKRDDIIRKYSNLSSKEALKKHKEDIKRVEEELAEYKRRKAKEEKSAKITRKYGHLEDPKTRSWNKEFGKPFADSHVDYLNYLTKPNTGDDYRKGKDLHIEKSEKTTDWNGEEDWDTFDVSTKNPVSNKKSDTITKYNELKRGIEAAKSDVDWHTYNPESSTGSSYAAMTDEQLESKIQKMRDDLEKQIEQLKKDNDRNSERRNEDIAKVKEREKELEDFLKAKGVRESAEYYNNINLKRLDTVIKESTK